MNRDTDPNAIRLWLTVTAPGGNWVSGGDLWTRDIVTAHTPSVGDDIALWWNEEDGDREEGPMWQVRNRYWTPDGLLNIELLPMLVDPDEAIDRSYSQWLANGRVHGTPWRTARDGDPIPKLEREWRRYRS